MMTNNIQDTSARRAKSVTFAGDVTSSTDEPSLPRRSTRNLGQTDEAMDIDANQKVDLNVFYPLEM